MIFVKQAVIPQGKSDRPNANLNIMVRIGQPFSMAIGDLKVLKHTFYLSFDLLSL